MGHFFDNVATNITDGWACAAVRAADHRGNTRVSPVLRICVAARGGCCAPVTPPDCTGTHDAATRTVSSTPCRAPKTFDDSGRAGDHELLRVP